MNPETHYHLDHLPTIDQCFVEEAHNAVYSWPSIDYTHDMPITSTNNFGNIRNHGIPIPTPTTTHRGMSAEGERHSQATRTISATSSFDKTKFAQDLVSTLGAIKCRYLYNSPWSLYDWHQDLGRHHSCINFLLTDTPGARTIHKFPMDCRLNYQVELTEYKLYQPVLFNAKIDHCVINLTDKHRYILSVLLFDCSYNTAKEYLKNYNLDTPGYL